MSKGFQWFIAGISFALLWASASTATKIGLAVAQPLMIAVVRFGIAAGILLFITHVLQKHRLPKQKEWRQLCIYGLLNISIYLGLYVVAMQKVTAGIGALAIASNPVFISFLSVFLLNKRLTTAIIFSLLICTIGVVCAAWPLLNSAVVTPFGLLLLLVSMVSYSAGAIYFSSCNWNGLSLLTINGWQTLLGGLFLTPFVLFFYKASANHFNTTFWLSVVWLAIPVSIVAVQLWLWLLNQNTVRAGLWLFLCPLFGFSIAAWLVKDTINLNTIIGVVLVLIGLLLSKINKKKDEMVVD